MGRTSDARERLVASGRELVHERGYTAVGVSEVCNRAGVNKGSFYHFFPSKQELVLEVIDSFWAGVREILQEMADADEPAAATLSKFFDGIHDKHRESRSSCGQMQGCPLGNLALEMSTQDVVLRDRLRRLFDRHVGYFEQVVRRGVTAGEFPEQDTQQTAQAILSLLEGALMLAKMQDDPSVLKGLGSDVLRLVGAGPKR